MKQKIEVIGDVGGETLPSPERRPHQATNAPRRDGAPRNGRGGEGHRGGGRPKQDARKPVRTMTGLTAIGRTMARHMRATVIPINRARPMANVGGKPYSALPTARIGPLPPIRIAANSGLSRRGQNRRSAEHRSGEHRPARRADEHRGGPAQTGVPNGETGAKREAGNAPMKRNNERGGEAAPHGKERRAEIPPA